MMHQFFEKYATKKTIYLGLLYILFINLVAFPFFSQFFGVSIPLGDILDTQFGFTTDYVQELFYRIEENGRKAYFFSTLFIDIPYTLIYGFVYSFLFVFLLRNKNIKQKNIAVYIPFFITVFDLIENTGIIFLLNSFPDYSKSIILITSLANQLKWISAGITLIVFFLIIFQNKKQIQN